MRREGMRGMTKRGEETMTRGEETTRRGEEGRREEMMRR